MRPIERRYTLHPPEGRPRWSKATTVDELIARITPFVGYFEGMFAIDEVALELEAALTGDDPEDERDAFGNEFAQPSLPPAGWACERLTTTCFDIPAWEMTRTSDLITITVYDDGEVATDFRDCDAALMFDELCAVVAYLKGVRER